MPTPGSHAYDTERARRRKDLENKGLNDQNANEAAKEEMAQRRVAQETDPAKDTDRARGPKAEP